MSKDNTKNNYSSTNYEKNLIKFLVKRKKEKKKKIYKQLGLKVQSRHLQITEFKI
jgi:hypothetical protein